MALNAAQLSTALQALTPTTSEATAIARLVDAYDVGYFRAGATCSGASVTGTTDPARAAMAAALVGVSAPNAGATKIAAGVTAYWGALVAPTVWVTAPVVLVPPIVPPPGLAGLAAALTATFAANVAAALALAPACDAVAATLHAASTGGSCPGSVPPAPPAPIPIL